MASATIPVNEVRWQVLRGSPDKVYSSFSDESEQEISEHPESESSNEFTKENEISTASWDSDTEVDSKGMFLLGSFD